MGGFLENLIGMLLLILGGTETLVSGLSVYFSDYCLAQSLRLKSTTVTSSTS